MFYSKIISCGSYLPERIMTNDDLSKMVDTNDEWIRERTGITQRHIAADEQYTSDLGYEAAKIALEKSDLSIDDIDSIIVATTTPDNIFPSTASKIQHKFAMKHGFAFDVQAVCSGFVYALSVADNYIKSGNAKNIIVIGAETMSRIIDWKDRNSCILFGDGAGAVILSAHEDPESNIISSKLYSDGEYYEILKTTGGPSLTGGAGILTMQGRDVFKHAVGKMSNAISEICKENNLALSDINSFIPHQANQRILSAIAKRLELKDSQLVSTVAKHANTSAASIPLALCDALDNNRINRGDYIVMTALGAGLTWGATLLKW